MAGLSDDPQPPALVGRLLRALPVAMRGKARVARALLGDRVQRSRDFMLETANGLRFHIPSLSEPIGWHLYIDGIYEPREVGWVLQQLQPGDTFIDCGANIGAFTVPAAKRVGPGGRVLAIDASARVLPYLRENVELNGLTNVTVCHAALDAQDGGQITFHEMPIGRFGGGSLVQRSESTEPVSVPRRSLDSLIAQHGIASASVIKIDIEGMEHRALQGARQTLATHPSLIFEFIAADEAKDAEPGDAQRLLMTAGFDVWRFDDHWSSRPPLEAPLTHDGATMIARPANRT